MTRWIVRESSSGRIFQVTTKGSDQEEVYKVFAEVVQGLNTGEDFDTGNVDIDVVRLLPQQEDQAEELNFDQGDE